MPYEFYLAFDKYLSIFALFACARVVYYGLRGYPIWTLEQKKNLLIINQKTGQPRGVKHQYAVLNPALAGSVVLMALRLLVDLGKLFF